MPFSLVDLDIPHVYENSLRNNKKKKKNPVNCWICIPYYSKLREKEEQSRTSPWPSFTSLPSSTLGSILFTQDNASSSLIVLGFLNQAPLNYKRPTQRGTSVGGLYILIDFDCDYRSILDGCTPLGTFKSRGSDVFHLGATLLIILG